MEKKPKQFFLTCFVEVEVEFGDLLVPKELNMSNNKLKCGAVKGDDPQSSHCSYNSMVQELTQLLKIPLVINSQKLHFFL